MKAAIQYSYSAQSVVLNQCSESCEAALPIYLKLIEVRNFLVSERDTDF